MQVQFRVLGPLSAEVGGREVDLGGPRQRAVLAALLAVGGSTVSAERLLEQVWSDTEPPSTATLFGYVAGLRRALEPGRAARTPPRLLVREGPGYALRVPAETVDAERFTRLVTEGGRYLDRGDPEAALRRFDEGLTLWRGPAYADFPDAPFAVSTVTRLESLQATARELRLAAMLAVGDLATAIGDLQALVIEHPLRERGWELLAVALYRAGRQGDALAVLRQARERLAADLGTDPGPGLHRVQQAILGQDESLCAPVSRTPALAGAAARALPSSRNLPAAISSFVGRHADRARLHALLAEHRLVTMVGPGGVGKTRLAMECLRERADPDGPWVVELAGVRDDALVARTVADALGLPLPSGLAELARLLTGRHTLLVLDNAEHLVDGVAETVAALLAAGPGMRVLVTSRQPLGIAGEALLELASLPPEDAVTLLAARMAVVLPGGGLTEADRPVAEELCRGLDGLPLAIELAAAQCRALSLRDIVNQLDDRFALLDSGRSGGHRHATLEQTIEWSHHLLTPSEQRLFRQLSVFDGGFDLAAAQRVGADPRVLPVLLGLVRKSLVMVDATSGTRRYRMLDSIRHYAAGLLSGVERATSRSRHRAWLLGLVEAAEQRLLTTDGAHWMQRLRQERDNIAAGLESALDAGDALGAARICAALAWFWFRTGQISDGTRWGRMAEAALLDRIAAEPQREKELLLVRARLLLAIGGVTYLVGDHAAATDVFRTSADLAERVDARDVRATAVSYLASMIMVSGDLVRAVAVADQAVALAELVGHPGIRAEALTVRGQISRAGGDLERAHRELTEANRLARECGHWWAVLSAGWADSKVSVDQGRPERALATLRALTLDTDPGNDRASWLALVHSLAGVLARTGQAELGAVLVGAVSALGAPIGYFPERMDPIDAPRSANAVRKALSGPAYQAAVARGSLLDWAELVALLRDRLAAQPVRGGRLR
ncbi:BTAD domain-containing putative transcriptional regulator [Micromonospora sp. WMMD1082]|uniref:BTAD domain-containing putative transcriptional regulator n=1 Tax=Micromonospora sp. WMMD1082 TaxID=3016104 RepID=UPI0024180F9B|nr:BTAD domain-containing putative transcriptional regulator [Micromonospora sp. WMMD1082]MDG4798477.1 BTAD domain-containing putative transcriptional regulator [Micromonospora sp. WMMD1082]